jgi:uncharacterized membrane protein YphA (DoxX/SURF4 family)
MSDSTARAFAPVVLRLGLALLYLWFGFSEIANVGAWTAWVPVWATSLTGLTATQIVLINGGFEIVAGALLAIGIWVRFVGGVLALHMLLLVVDIGLDQIGVRDLAICFATMALALGGADWLALDRRLAS